MIALFDIQIMSSDWTLDHLGKLRHFDTDFEFKRGIYSFSMVIDSFSLNFRVELNLSLTEARRKAHNKPINTLSGLVHAGERLRNL